MQQADAVLVGFAHADDAAAADGDARRARTDVDGAQAIVVAARGDDLAVKFRRGIEIVVVGRQAGGGQAASLIVGEHAERAADFHAQRSDGAHHLQHAFKFLAVAHFAPRRAHAKARGALVVGFAGRFVDLRDAEQVLLRYARLIMRALRAIGAILGAAARFDGEQLAELHLAGIVKFAMHLLRGKNQIEQRPLIDLLDLAPRPIMPQAGVRRALAQRFRGRLSHPDLSSRAESAIVTRFARAHALFVSAGGAPSRKTPEPSRLRLGFAFSVSARNMPPSCGQTSFNGESPGACIGPPISG